jgi:hypothetical protein
VRDEVQRAEDHDGHRLVEVDDAPHAAIGDDLLRVQDVALDHRRALVAGEDRAAVGDDDRIAVDVDHTRAGDHRPRDLMGVLPGGEPGTDVEELPDALLGDIAHGPPEEAAVLRRHGLELRGEREQLLRGSPVGGEIVLTAEKVIIHAGDIGSGRVELPEGPPRRAGHYVRLSCPMPRS